MASSRGRWEDCRCRPSPSACNSEANHRRVDWEVACKCKLGSTSRRWAPSWSRSAGQLSAGDLAPQEFPHSRKYLPDYSSRGSLLALSRLAEYLRCSGLRVAFWNSWALLGWSAARAIVVWWGCRWLAKTFFWRRECPATTATDAGVAPKPWLASQGLFKSTAWGSLWRPPRSR